MPLTEDEEAPESTNENVSTGVFIYLIETLNPSFLNKLNAPKESAPSQWRVCLREQVGNLQERMVKLNWTDPSTGVVVTKNRDDGQEKIWQCYKSMEAMKNAKSSQNLHSPDEYRFQVLEIVIPKWFHWMMQKCLNCTTQTYWGLCIKTAEDDVEQGR